MRKIAIIGANDYQNRLILKAKEMGIETHVFAWKDGAIGEQTADYFYPISIMEKDSILEQCIKICPDAICSIASDLAVVTVNYVAEKLSLPCNGIETSLYTTNKYAMRKKLAQCHLPTPDFFIISECSKLQSSYSYPLIVKPTDRSGSRGVNKVYNNEDLRKAICNAITVSFENKAIVEQFLEGSEYSCECISFKGQHKLLAITKKFTTGAPHFIETGHLQPCGLSKLEYKKIELLLIKALDALNIKTGASHSEIKIDEKGNIGIIEIGARMGGDCIGSDLVELSTGYDFLKMVIQTALGDTPDLIRKHDPRYAGIRFLFNENDLVSLDNNLLEIKGKVIRVYKENVSTKEVTDSSSRLGYYIFMAKSLQEIDWIFDYDKQ